MSDRHDIIAYLATLATLFAIFALSLVIAAYHPTIVGKIEAFGLGTITGGLIGILRIPSARNDPSAANPIADEAQP